MSFYVRLEWLNGIIHIEVTRAGEHGKGFPVDASEARKLAGRSWPKGSRRRDLTDKDKRSEQFAIA